MNPEDQDEEAAASAPINNRDMILAEDVSEEEDDEDEDVSEEEDDDSSDPDTYVIPGEAAAFARHRNQIRNRGRIPAEDVSDDDSIPGRPPPRDVPEARQLIDEEEWFNQNGLAAEPRYGFDSYNNQQETRQRIQQEQDYQKDVHEKIFLEDQKKSKRSSSYEADRSQYLQQWKDATVVLRVKPTNAHVTAALISVNLAHLAHHSQMVYSLAYANALQEQKQDEQRKDGFPPRKQRKQGDDAIADLSLSLEDFSLDAVQSLLNLTLNAFKTEDVQEEQKLPDHLVDNLNPDHVVDCCRLAHYLQCDSILQQLTEDILLPSIDSKNCISLCQLAEQLSLSELHEASLKHILWSLDQMEEESGESSDNSAASAMLNNDYLTPDLKQKIENIKQILRTQNRKTIFFDTFVEYISMLAEQYQYYKERLEEAREQQERLEAGTQGWIYAESKIQQQTEKVKKMRTFLTEQKKIFGVGQGDENEC